MNIKSFSIVAVMAITLTGFTTSAIAGTKEEDQKHFNDCFTTATANGVSKETATLGCISVVSKDNRVKPQQRLKLKQYRASRVPKQRPRVRTKRSRY